MLSSDGKYINQVDSRILRCRKSYFSFNNVGMPITLAFQLIWSSTFGTPYVALSSGLKPFI